MPHGTFLGWNLRREGFAPGELCSLTGSFIAFADTRAERLANRDSRLSIEERYPTQKAYIEKVEDAVGRLVDERLLLKEDAERILGEAKRSDRGRPTSL